MKRLSEALSAGQRVWVPTLNAESALLREELTADGGRAAGVTFMGVQFPGIDTIDYLRFHPQARMWGCFMSPAARAGWQDGRAEIVPADYQAMARWLTDMPPVDVAIAQLAPPDAQGWCSPGVSADFLPLVWPTARRRIAHINPAMPSVRSAFRVHIDELDGCVQASRPLSTFAESPPDALESQIAAAVAQLIPDGATLQMGIGGIPLALAGALADHRGLRLHTGMVTRALPMLWHAGALDRDAPVTTGAVLGDHELHSFCASLGTLWLADVRHTHDPAVIGNHRNFMAVNSAVEVDLFGQVNSERSPRGLIAGAGGLPAFAQGAWRSQGGRLIIGLPATAKGGSVSRIVPAIGAQGLCTLPRHLADVIVTEHGVARLRGLGLDARAEALIAIAAPQHRSALASAWQDMRRNL